MVQIELKKSKLGKGEWSHYLWGMLQTRETSHSLLLPGFSTRTTGWVLQRQGSKDEILFLRIEKKTDWKTERYWWGYGSNKLFKGRLSLIYRVWNPDRSFEIGSSQSILFEPWPSQVP